MDWLGKQVIPPQPHNKENGHVDNIYGRRIKWEYVIPIIFTPSAHMFVSLIKKYPQYKRRLYWGVGIATLLTLQARFILMYDAGYPGKENMDKKELPWYMKMLLF